MNESKRAATEEVRDVIKTEHQGSGDDLPLDKKIDNAKGTPPVNGSDELQDENDPGLTIPKEEIQAENSGIDDSHPVGSELDKDETTAQSKETQSILYKDDDKQGDTENLIVHSENDKEAPPLQSEVDKESPSADIDLEVSSKLVKPAEDAEIQPTEAAKIQPKEDSEIQPAEDADIGDAKIQSTEVAETQPTEDAEIKPASETQSAEEKKTLPKDAVETSLVQPDKKVDTQCEDLENIKNPEEEMVTEPQDKLDTSSLKIEEPELEQSEAGVENQPEDEEMQDDSNIDTSEEAQFVLPEVEDSTGPSNPEKTQVVSLDEDTEMFDLSTKTAPAGNDYDFDNDFEGFTDEKSNVLVIDFDKLKINKVEFGKLSHLFMLKFAMCIFFFFI